MNRYAQFCIRKENKVTTNAKQRQITKNEQKNEKQKRQTGDKGKHCNNSNKKNMCGQKRRIKINKIDKTQTICICFE